MWFTTICRGFVPKPKHDVAFRQQGAVKGLGYPNMGAQKMWVITRLYIIDLSHQSVG